MFEIIGFIATVGFFTWLTLAWCLIAFNTLGRYNIGGVPNTVKDKVLTIVLLAVLALGWSAIFKNSPFQITSKTTIAHGIKE